MFSSKLTRNISFIQSNIKSAALQTGRNINDIKIVAVTKAFPSPIWNLALKNNLTTIGESQIQEVENKVKDFKQREQIELHLIGHLQRNKVKRAVKLFDIIQTVDSLKLASRINKISKEEKKIQKIFLQVNTGKDKNKYGLMPIETMKVAKEITSMKNISLIGIMTIPPQTESNKKLRSIYKRTKEIRDVINKKIEKECKYLSMGMSNDFETAISEGATHIRLGTALFGKRPK